MQDLPLRAWMNGPLALELGFRDFEVIPLVAGVVDAGLAETAVVVLRMVGAVPQNAADVVDLDLPSGPNRRIHRPGSRPQRRR